MLGLVPMNRRKNDLLMSDFNNFDNMLDDFFDDRISDYWPDWEGDTVICNECGADFTIGSVEVD